MACSSRMNDCGPWTATSFNKLRTYYTNAQMPDRFTCWKQRPRPFHQIFCYLYKKIVVDGEMRLARKAS